MNYYEIRDRVPCEEIDALTVEAARVWLERNGWEFVEFNVEGGGIWKQSDDIAFAQLVNSPWLTQAVGWGAWQSGKRVHVVIAEIRAIAEWQKRCAEWVPPKEGEMCPCWKCADVRIWTMSCPTCSNKRCPRATDHRLGCSGSNEPGQEGSRYQ